MRIGIVLGSVREGRKGTSAAAWLMGIAAERTDAEFVLIDLADYDLPVLTDETVPFDYEGTYPQPNVQAWADALKACDGYVWLTPEYNHGVPGGFKNAVDYLGMEMAFKPVAFVSYGFEGGVRAVEAWRPILAAMHLWGLRNQVALDNATEFDGNQVRPAERRAGAVRHLYDAVVLAATKLQS
ncbi:NADPH-dependent FMN reductase [Tessaracoccus lubricantis]|uniref:NADPH-dependent FMN reductase n=1 Tax=Tessaracoccus lubricantis TaxID=545543 RepID=A0ABP9F5W8_9ACTN